MRDTHNENPLLIFIHGGGVGSWMWEHQASYFNKANCIFVTLEGHGVRHEETGFTIEEQAKEILEIIAKNRERRPVCLIGFSIGAQIALRCIERAPEQIDFAMINSALVRPMHMMKHFISPLVRLSSPLIRNRSFAKLQAKELYMDKEFFERYYEESIHMKVETLINVLRDNMRFQLSALPTNIQTKLLITVGANEKRVMRQSAKHIHRHFPNAQLEIIEQMKHGFPIAQPTRFNSLLRNWLEDHGVRGIVNENHQN